MESRYKILIVDDDPEIRELLSDYLDRNGFITSTAADGIEMREKIRHTQFDLVILDLMMPGDDGLTLCRDLRSHSNLPVIMLTARGDETDRIVGLEMGADDYLPKPFSPRELQARIKAVLRRTENPATTTPKEPDRLEFAGWQLDLKARHLISPDGVIIALSGGEYRLLNIFLERPQHVLSRDQLMELIQGREAMPYDRSIDVQVSRLRQRLNEDARTPTIIKTVRGQGYVFTVTVKAVA